jgi:hypothetical protein
MDKIKITYIDNNYTNFIDYIEAFYLPSHPKVLYPIEGLTRGDIAIAVLKYLDLLEASDTMTWGHGDSIDRERVRDIINVVNK